MNDPHRVFCGKCGAPNPADNLYCRSCGHRLADDIVSPDELAGQAQDPAQVAPIEGIEPRRYPLIDRETREPLPIDVEPAPRPTPSRPPNHRRKLILRSAGLHLLLVPLAVLASTLVVNAVIPMPRGEQPTVSQAAELFGRFEEGQITQEQLRDEWRRLIPLDDDQMLIAFTIVQGFAVLGFFVSGLICGRRWRPERLMDVGFGALIVGVLSACLCHPLVWLLGFIASLAGASLGRGWGR